MKWRPRVSLLSLLLLMTTLALAISLWQMGRDIVPLRNAVRELRDELGQFAVADSSRLHVQRSETVTGKSWKWRLYLPPNAEYRLNVAEGDFSELLPGDFANWRDQNVVRGGSLGRPDAGQFTLEVGVEDYRGTWWIRSATKHEIGGSLALEEDWYAELPEQIQYSDASFERVSVTDASEPFVLLYVRRGKKEEVDNTYVTKQTTGKAPTFVIWISSSRPLAMGTSFPSGPRVLRSGPLNRRTSEQ